MLDMPKVKFQISACEHTVQSMIDDHAKELSKLVQQEVKKYIDGDEIEKQIKEQIRLSINRAISRQISNYFEYGKGQTKIYRKIEEAMQNGE